MTILRSKENEPNKTTKEQQHEKAKKDKMIEAKAPIKQAIGNPDFVRSGLKEEIAKQVVRKKLAKLRHLVLEKAISPEYLDSLFPSLLEHFEPQTVTYNGGIANIKKWKVCCGFQKIMRFERAFCSHAS